MTKLRKKLLLSVLTLALTFIALGSTTFAWFTLGNTATANAFTGTVQAGQGIDIAFEDSSLTEWSKYNWTSSVDLQTKILSAFRFKDLTSSDGVTFKSLSNGVDSGSAEVNKDYVEINLVVRSLGKLTDLNLKNVAGVSSTSFNWNVDANVKESTGEGYEFQVGGTSPSWNALNAMRVSFTTVDNTTKTATKVISFELTDTTHAVADASATGLAFRYADAKGFKVTANASAKFPALAKTIEALEVNGSYADDLNIKLNDGVVEYASYNDAADNGGNTYYIYKVTVRVWMEGWDGDCINAILGKSINFGFILEGKYTNA